MKTTDAIGTALIALALQGCDIVNPSRGLANYFRKLLDSGKITVSEVSVGMFPSSRMGYFIFTLPPQEFIKLTAALSLNQIASLDDERRTCLHYREGLEEVSGAKFDIWNPGWNPDDTNTWLDEKGNDIRPTKPSISIYYADPPLPPMPGNSRTSFNHLFYDSTTGTCLAILEYPYG
jgi:hypothetical protein